MTDMTPTIAPKSDQLNSDDLIVGPMTVKITKVSLLAGDQPVGINFEGDNSKPYKPCKSMRRVLVQIWGSDGNAYVGHSMTLYRDESVTFGKDQVGGIRISHMSHIESEITLALTTSRARRKPYRVRPLTVAADAEPALVAAGSAAAHQGVEAYLKWIKTIPKADKESLRGHHGLWKEIAKHTDHDIRTASLGITAEDAEHDATAQSEQKEQGSPV